MMAAVHKAAMAATNHYGCPTRILQVDDEGGGRETRALPTGPLCAPLHSGEKR